jgi:hypothetical protein
MVPGNAARDLTAGPAKSGLPNQACQIRPAESGLLSRRALLLPGKSAGESWKHKVRSVAHSIHVFRSTAARPSSGFASSGKLEFLPSLYEKEKQNALYLCKVLHIETMRMRIYWCQVFGSKRSETN